MTKSKTRIIPRLLFAALAALALAGCETTGTGTAAQTAKAPEPPMTRRRAAEQCWMSTEKGATSMSLDKRADVVNKCIEDKMKGGSASAAPAREPEAKKKKPAAATAEAQKKKPAAAAGEKDKKPADTDEADKKP
jgi:type IV pilus biogenesis protein CpaD/CtpE